MILLILLFFCHLLGDYVLVSNKMLAAKRFGTPLMPIYDHAAVHGFLMGILVWIHTHNYHTGLGALGVQSLLHFIIDLWKGKMNYWFPATRVSSNKVHWYLFGFDQFLHALVIIIIWRVVI